MSWEKKMENFHKSFTFSTVIHELKILITRPFILKNLLHGKEQFSSHGFIILSKKHYKKVDNYLHENITNIQPPAADQIKFQN